MSKLFVGAGNSLQALNAVEIDSESLSDIQLRVKLQPHFLGEALVIIGESADFPQIGSADDHVLIALDINGNIVVIELKEGIAKSGETLSCLRYASYLAGLSVDELGKVAHSFVNRSNNISILRSWQENSVEMSDEAVELSSLLATAFERDAEDFADNINRTQRIIIAADGFDSLMVDMVEWLCKGGADVRGLHYRKFMIGGQEIFFAEQVVPKVDPAIDGTGNKKAASPEAEEPWRVKGLQYYIDRLTPSTAGQLRNLLEIVRPHTFNIDWSHKYYFIIRGARRNLRIRVYHRDRIDIGFMNAAIEGVNELLSRHHLNQVEAAVIGGYDKSPFVATTSDTEFDQRWQNFLGYWLSEHEGAAVGSTTATDI